MAYWSFSDVFEEQGVVKKPFYGGYGLIAVGGIPKAAFNAFAMLHRLGDQRLSPELKDALVTKRGDGTLAIAVWNYADRAHGAPRDVRAPVHPGRAADVTILDEQHGSALTAVAEDGRACVPQPRAAAGAAKRGGLPSPQHADPGRRPSADAGPARAGADRGDALIFQGL